MHVWKFAVPIGVVLSMTLLGSSTAWSCACCADHGERSDEVSDRGETAQALLDDVKFAKKSTLYLTAGGWEEIAGMTNPAEAWQYNVRIEKERENWVFSFADNQGHDGTLNLKLPNTVRLFAVDTKPQEPDDGDGEPTTLYKELILETSVDGSGIFARPGKTRAKARLILHGQGNRCDDAGQFTNWTLDVSDKGAKYRFFGKLVPPT